MGKFHKNACKLSLYLLVKLSYPSCLTLHFVLNLTIFATGEETHFGTEVRKNWVAPWCLVPFEKLAVVPQLFQN